MGPLLSSAWLVQFSPDASSSRIAMSSLVTTSFTFTTSSEIESLAFLYRATAKSFI
jgi:hypothetical protein